MVPFGIDDFSELMKSGILTMTLCGGAVKSTYFAGEETKAQGQSHLAKAWQPTAVECPLTQAGRCGN